MPWVDDVQGILEGYLGGQAGSGAIADILYGKVNPCGKLAETFPLRLEDNPSHAWHAWFPGGPATVEYRESLYVGYRYYDSVPQEVLFPFGYGLCYTGFSYSALALKPSQGPDGLQVEVSLKVKNTLEVAGKEVVQVYVRDPEWTVFRPEKELKGFAKVALEPGEEKDVTILLDRRAFTYYDAAQRDWVLEAGVFEILVGASSRDIRLSGALSLASEQTATVPSQAEKRSAYYKPQKGMAVSQADFETLLGRSVPPNLLQQKGGYTFNTPITDMGASIIGRLLFRVMRQQINKMIAGIEGTPTALMMESTLNQMPLRTMLMLGGRGVRREALEALLLMINGRFFKGLAALVRPGRTK